MNTAKFKRLASCKLPEHLYRQVEPYLDKLLHDYEDMEDVHAQYARDLYERYDKIRDEFKTSHEKEWATFARERWPEIEHYFNLRRPDDDLPF